MKRFFKIAVFVVVIAASLLLIVGQPTAGFTHDEFTKNDYSNIMRDNISGDPLVTEIAMLAAHDALTAGIKKDSPINYLDGGNFLVGASEVMSEGVVNAVAGGFIARTAVAQKSSAYNLLKRGVRYIDVRVAEYGDGFYACHGKIADPISDFLADTLKFLEETDGELVVVEIRHGYFDKTGHAELFEYIKNSKLNGKSLFDYIRFDPMQIPLENLRYKTATSGGSGVVLLAPEAPFDGPIPNSSGGSGTAAHGASSDISFQNLMNGGFGNATTLVYEDDGVFGGLAYTAEPYAVWHNQTKENLMLEGIRGEYRKLKENTELHRNTFRVNQAQRTPKFEADSIFEALIGWSLIDMAYKYNYTLLTQDDFKEWLSVMPVFQVDYADGMYEGFNDKVIEIINEYNAELK
jgi:hypothetical protein